VQTPAQKRLSAGSAEQRTRESLDEAKRELEVVASEKDLRRYRDVPLSDREWELMLQEQQRKFAKYRRSAKLNERER
jgi:hypothetical protein